MKSSIIELIKQAVATLNIAELDQDPTVERTKDKKHGDYACNIALVLAKAAKQNPRQLAEKIIAALPHHNQVAKVEIAGPGFINFYLTNDALTQVVAQVLQQGDRYGLNHAGQHKKVHIEFVSANPTGPLHVGHGRGAAFGSAVADLLEAVGFDVHREYYVNDAGRQMNILAASVWLRYLSLHQVSFDFPSNGYKGDYVIAISEQLQQQYGDKFVRPIAEVFANVPQDATSEGSGDKEAHIDGLVRNAQKLLGADYAIVFDAGLQSILADIKQDLAEFGVEYQQWFSEKSLETDGLIKHCIQVLTDKGFVYHKDGAQWFRATDFGDDKDRVLVRANGDTTYFASDVAYHLNKYERGFDKVIDIFGSDHHGYIPRLRAMLQAVDKGDEDFETLLVQFAILYRGSEKVQMSTRSGEFITLRELRDEVGKDAARFFYVMRKNDQHMDFDLELAKSQSNENPVYYIQYAHARVCSVFRQLADKKISWDQDNGLTNLALLTTDHENELLTSLARYPELLTIAALQHEPHLLAHYLQKIANQFHTYYNAQQFIVDDKNLRDARLSLIAATRQVIHNGLQLLSVSTPESM